jgi:hypothetical protein
MFVVFREITLIDTGRSPNGYIGEMMSLMSYY